MSRILLSIKPEYIDKIFSGTKKFEYRKKLCRADVGTIVIYSTRPVMMVVGEVEVVGTISGTVGDVWEQTQEYSGVTKAFFDSYFNGTDKAFAYKLGAVKQYVHPRLLGEFGVKCAPQSFVYIK